jgi:hypothetical protein
VTKQRGNQNWGKPDVDSSRCSGPTSFEEIVRKLCLSPEDYEHSIPLKEWVQKNKEWVQKNKDQKYVPVDLLRAWDFVVKGDV